jgi:hypothetical protein
MSVEEDYSIFDCALFNDANPKHVVEEPIMLQCNHNACKSCLSESKNTVKCRICGKINQIDLLKATISKETETNIRNNINGLLIRLENQIIAALDDLKSKFRVYF